jgi:hypothetical protein
MKTRIIASILVIIVVGALLFISENDTAPGNPVAPHPTTNESALKTLSL